MQQFLTLAALDDSSEGEFLHEKKNVELGVITLSTLHNANRLYNLLDYREFYNDGVSENFNAIEDLGSDGFKIFHHPFLLSPESKARAIEAESLVIVSFFTQPFVFGLTI